MWQSSEFFKVARNNRDTGFSAASHLTFDLFLGVAGLAPAILFSVLFQKMNFILYETRIFDDNGQGVSLEDFGVPLTFALWMSTVYMWSGMALVAAYMTPTLGLNARNS